MLDRSGIGLHRDLAIGRECERRAAGVKKLEYRGRIEQAWGAATQEYRVDDAVVCSHRLLTEIANNRIEVTTKWRIVASRVGIEVAVGALSDAPWQGRQIAHDPAGSASCNSLRRALNALPRWLTAFFSSRLSSAPVFPDAGSRKTGS